MLKKIHLALMELGYEVDHLDLENVRFDELIRIFRDLFISIRRIDCGPFDIKFNDLPKREVLILKGYQIHFHAYTPESPRGFHISVYIEDSFNGDLTEQFIHAIAALMRAKDARS